MCDQEMSDSTLCVTCKKPATKWLKLTIVNQSSCGEEECENKAILKHQEDIHEPKQIIELDCPPGLPRPGDLIAEVIKDTGLELKEKEGVFFGNWDWDYSEVDPEVWQKAKPILKKRIQELYHEGLIRYGSW